MTYTEPEATVILGDQRITVRNPQIVRDEEDMSPRIEWFYTIAAPGVSYSRRDLYTPHYVDDAHDALCTLITFLSACAESQNYPDGENADLFPEHVINALDIDAWFIWSHDYVAAKNGCDNCDESRDDCLFDLYW